PIVFSGFRGNGLGHADDHAFGRLAIERREGMVAWAIGLPFLAEARQRGSDRHYPPVLPFLFEPADRRIDAAVETHVGGIFAPSAQTLNDRIVIACRALHVEREIGLVITL